VFKNNDHHEATKRTKDPVQSSRNRKQPLMHTDKHFVTFVVNPIF